MHTYTFDLNLTYNFYSTLYLYAWFFILFFYIKIYLKIVYLLSLDSSHQQVVRETLTPWLPPTKSPVWLIGAIVKSGKLPG